MARYRPPACVAELPNGRQCGHDTVPLSERDPSFGPNYRPGNWVFRCNYCGSIRILDKQHLDRYVHRI